jgi:predicted nucleic acid-binding protein
MAAVDAFFDTNVLLYLLSDDARRADRAEALLVRGGVISVQVLNEFAAVALRKPAMTLPEVREVLTAIRALCAVEPLSLATHDLGMQLSERFGFAIYDSFIVAAALLAKCRYLYSEDLRHGQKIDTLTIRNPFKT